MESEAPNSGNDLTPEEIQDLVVVATVRTMPEAVFITDTLEDTDIPAAMRTDNLGGLTNNAFEIRICVPRRLKDRAAELITQARHTAEDQQVVNTFSEDRDEAERYAPNAMAGLRDLELPDRLVRLEGHVAEWLSAELEPVEIARNLAVAGLDLTQANALIEKVQREHGEAIQRGKESRLFVIGMGLLVVGCIVFVMQLVFPPLPGMRAIPIGLLVAGFAVLLSAPKPPPKSLMHESSEASATSDQNKTGT